MAVRYAITYAGITLPAITMGGDRSRRVAILEPERGDGVTLIDRGRRAKTDSITCELLAATENQVYDQLVALRDSGDARLLQHPVEGQYFARLTGLRTDIANGRRAVTLELVEEVRVQQVSVSEVVTIDAITASVERVQAAMDALPAITVTPEAASDLAKAWADDLPVADEQVRQLEDWRTTARDDVETLGGLDLVDARQALVAYLELRGQMEVYAEQTRAQALQSFTAEVVQPHALRALVTDLYGAEEAEERYQQVIALNPAITNVLVPQGTILRLPRAA